MKFTQPWLRHPADRRTLFLLGLLTAGLITGWWRGSWLLLAPITVLAVTACCAKHNHIHCPTFRYRWLNRLFDFWLTLLTGSTTGGIRVAHLVRHHGNNQSPEDFVRCSQVHSLPPLHALLTFAPRVIAAAWTHSRNDLSPHRRKGLRRARLQEALLLWLVILSGLTMDPGRFLLFPVIPWLLSQWFLVTVNLPQHDGCDPTSPLAHSRNSTGKITNWLLLNNGYHTAHHLAPGRHWSNLAGYHNSELASGIPPGLNCYSFGGFWISWWRGRRKEVAP